MVQGVEQGRMALRRLVINEVGYPFRDTDDPPNAEEVLLCRGRHGPEEQSQESRRPHQESLCGRERSYGSTPQGCDEGVHSKGVAVRGGESITRTHTERLGEGKAYLETKQHVLVLPEAEDKERDGDEEDER